MKPTNRISATAIAAALMLASLAMPAAACMEMSPDEQASLNDLIISGVPVAGTSEPAVINPAEKYVILAPVRPGAPPQVVRWNGIDVSPAPEVLVVEGRAVTQDTRDALAASIELRALQEAQLVR
jgi:hypothetical protein